MSDVQFQIFIAWPPNHYVNLGLAFVYAHEVDDKPVDYQALQRLVNETVRMTYLDFESANADYLRVRLQPNWQRHATRPFPA